MESSSIIDISIWEDQILQIKEGEFFQITNCKVKHFYGKKLRTSHVTVIQPAEQQDITDATFKTADLKPCICCPEIQNVVIDMHAICNTKACNTRITGNTESKNLVHCTSCNRAMLIRNCYRHVVEINTTFQLEKDDRQYSVMANQNTISNYLGEDIFQYKDNVDELMEKLLLLENVDFELSTNGRMLTQMVDHQDKPDDQTKDN